MEEGEKNLEFDDEGQTWSNWDASNKTKTILLFETKLVVLTQPYRMVYKRLFSHVNLAMPVQSVRTEAWMSYFEINNSRI